MNITDTIAEFYSYYEDKNSEYLIGLYISKERSDINTDVAQGIISGTESFFIDDLFGKDLYLKTTAELDRLKHILEIKMYRPISYIGEVNIIRKGIYVLEIIRVSDLDIIMILGEFDIKKDL